MPFKVQTEIDLAVIEANARHEGSETKPELGESEPIHFPQSAWRGVFADYRDAMENTTEASDVSHFAALWATCAVRLGRSVYMEAGDTTYANAYICFFGATGDKKTTAARRPRSLGLLDGVHVISNVGSAEGLADALHPGEASGDPGTALFFWEEFGSFLSRARWKNATILEFFTETFDCPPEWGLRYRDKNRITVRQPTPSILTGTTTDWFWKSARSDDFHGGFGNRFVYLTGRKKAPMPSPSEPNKERIEALRNRLARLGSYSGPAYFSPEAGELWDLFYVDFESKERMGLLAAALKRIHVYVRKLAMVFAATEGTLPMITADQLKSSIAVCLYSAECARLLIEAQAASRPEGELERKFLDWLGKHDGERKRYMQQTLSKYAGSCEVFNKTLTNLARADMIEIRDGRVFVNR